MKTQESHNKDQEADVGDKVTLHTYASGSGALTFVLKDENRNPVSGRRPQANECIDYLKQRMAEGRGIWKGSDWMIVNQGPLDRENHEHYEAVRQVTRVGENALQMNGNVYEYDPAQVQGHVTPKFTFDLAGRTQEIEGTGNNGALGYFLRNEKILSNPERIVWDSAKERIAVEKVTVADIRPDIKGKLLVENAQSLDDAELHRVFDTFAAPEFCIREAQRARDAGITIDDIRAESAQERENQVRASVDGVCEKAKALGVDVDSAAVRHAVEKHSGPDKGVLVGKILAVDGKTGLVYQSTGRDGKGAVFPVDRLSRGVTEGAVEKITFKNGTGTVADRGKDLGRGR